MKELQEIRFNEQEIHLQNNLVRCSILPQKSSELNRNIIFDGNNVVEGLQDDVQGGIHDGADGNHNDGGDADGKNIAHGLSAGTEALGTQVHIGVPTEVENNGENEGNDLSDDSCNSGAGDIQTEAEGHDEGAVEEHIALFKDKDGV